MIGKIPSPAINVKCRNCWRHSTAQSEFLFSTIGRRSPAALPVAGFEKGIAAPCMA